MPNQTLPHTDKLIKAVFCCIGAHFLFFIMGLTAKYLSATHHVAEIAFYRNFFVFVPIFLFIVLTKKMHLLRTKRPRLVLIRGAIGSISVITVFAALNHLPMAYATVLFFASSLLTPVLAFIFLKEHVGLHRWSAVIIGMVGLLIISQPSGEVSMLGLFFALAAACLHASMFIVLRALKTERPITVTLYFFLLGFIIPGVFFMPWVAQPLTLDDIWILVIIALSGGMAQYFLACAYKFAPASYITPFMYTSLLWNVLADILYWKYDIDLSSVLIGAGLILCAQLFLIFIEYMNKRPKQVS